MTKYQKYTLTLSALFIIAGMYLFTVTPGEVTHTMSLVLIAVISGWSIGIGLLLLVMGIINR